MSAPTCLGCGHAKRNHINGVGLCLVKSCRLCLSYRPTIVAPTWCVICDDRHVTGSGVVCEFCLETEAKALAATPRGERAAEGGVHVVGVVGAPHRGREAG